MNKAASVDKGESIIPTYVNERVVEEPSRRIGYELYHNTGCDAICRIFNSGFVIRLDTSYIFFDPIFTSPPLHYEAHRARVREGGEHPCRIELKCYDRPENISREIHTLPLLAEEVEKVDYVLLSHEQQDHFDLSGLQ